MIADRAVGERDLLVLPVDLVDHIANHDQRLLDLDHRLAGFVVDGNPRVDLGDHLLGFVTERIDGAGDFFRGIAGV